MTTTTQPADLYPTRGATEVISPRQDPVVWGESGAADLRDYDRDGFLTVDQLMTPTEVKTYRAELDRLLADPAVRADERAVIEPKSQEIRSVFEVHKLSEVFAGLVRDTRLLDYARRILGSDVYVHQSRVNVKPGFGASG